MFLSVYQYRYIGIDWIVKKGKNPEKTSVFLLIFSELTEQKSVRFYKNQPINFRFASHKQLINALSSSVRR